MSWQAGREVAGSENATGRAKVNSNPQIACMAAILALALSSAVQAGEEGSAKPVQESTGESRSEGFLQPSAGAPDPGEPPTGPLTATEQRLQGRWHAYGYGAAYKAYTLDFQERRFEAEGEAGDWYKGWIAVREQAVPAELDFVIEACACKYEGMVSQAIYRWDGETLVMAAPAPESDRPAIFDESTGEMMQLRRAEEESSEPSQE